MILGQTFNNKVLLVTKLCLLMRRHSDMYLVAVCSPPDTSSTALAQNIDLPMLEERGLNGIEDAEVD